MLSLSALATLLLLLIDTLKAAPSRPLKQEKLGWEHCSKFYCAFRYLNGTLRPNIPLPKNMNINELPLCASVLYTMLKDIDETLSESNIDYYITFGTLLGSLQQKDLFPWTSDLDLAVSEQNFTSLVSGSSTDGSLTESMVDVFLSRGLVLFQGGLRLIRMCASDEYFIKHHPTIDGKTVRLSKDRMGVYVSRFVYVDVYKEIDISKAAQERDQLMLQVNPSQCLYRKKDIYPLKGCRIRDEYFNCPSQSRYFLYQHYGHNFGVSLDQLDSSAMDSFGCV
jgi:hypothetical protein